MRTSLYLIAAIIVLHPGLAQAAPIAILNHSFEVDVMPRDGNTNSPGDDFNADILPSNWLDFDDGRNNAVAGNARGIVSHANDSFFNASLTNTPDADANDQSFFTAQRDIYQVLTETLQANTTYTLSVDIGDRNAGGAAGNPGTPIIRLGTGSTPNQDLLTPDMTDFPAQVDGNWVTWTATYETGPSPTELGEPLRIELTNGTNVGWFDNVRLDAVTSAANAVPEPISLIAWLLTGTAVSIVVAARCLSTIRT